MCGPKRHKGGRQRELSHGCPALASRALVVSAHGIDSASRDIRQHRATPPSALQPASPHDSARMATENAPGIVQPESTNRPETDHRPSALSSPQIWGCMKILKQSGSE